MLGFGAISELPLSSTDTTAVDTSTHEGVAALSGSGSVSYIKIQAE